VKDPREVVKTGQIVTVKVLEVDPQRKRISLSMRMDDKAEASTAPRQQVNRSAKQNPRNNKQAAAPSALAAAFAKAGKRS